MVAFSLSNQAGRAVPFDRRIHKSFARETQVRIAQEMGTAAGDGTFTAGTAFSTFHVGVAAGDINNDGLNDSYRPVTKGLKNIRFDIYDTWGSLIFSETGDVLQGWDGKIKGVPSENGNYNCKVSAETFYGKTITVEETFVLIK